MNLFNISRSFSNYYAGLEIDVSLLLKHLQHTYIPNPGNFTKLIHSLWQVKSINEKGMHKLMSSGSTKQRKPYTFGPLESLIATERIIKKPDNHHTLYISLKQGKPVNLTHNAGCVHDIVFNLAVNKMEDNSKILMQIIQDYAKKTNGPIALMSRPNTFLYLFSSPLFSAFLIKNKELISSIISSDWDAFFKQKHLKQEGIHINDNMISWQTGLNFYTCKQGEKHFLPIFHTEGGKTCNLLNLTTNKSVNDDDKFYFTGPTIKCECGLFRTPFKFTAHWRYSLSESIVEDFMAVPEQLQDRYINLQFVRNEQTLDVLFVKNNRLDISNHDGNCIKELAEKHDLQVSFHPNKELTRGAKKPIFWHSEKEFKDVT